MASWLIQYRLVWYWLVWYWLVWYWLVWYWLKLMNRFRYQSELVSIPIRIGFNTNLNRYISNYYLWFNLHSAWFLDDKNINLFYI